MSCEPFEDIIIIILQQVAFLKTYFVQLVEEIKTKTENYGLCSKMLCRVYPEQNKGGEQQQQQDIEEESKKRCSCSVH